MNKLVIEGIPALDGTYEFEDFEDFTNRELHRIKKLTGLRVGEFDEAFRVGDNDVLIGLAVVVLERTGRQVNDELLWDAPAGGLRFEFDEVADPTQAEVPSPEPDSSSKPTSLLDTSGNGSTEPSASPAIDPSPTGHPA